MIEKHQRAKGSLMGFIIGDALGVPFKGLSRAEMTARPATGMTGFGTHHQPPGTWSHASSMMLCILENVIHHGNMHSLAKRLIRFYKEGYMSPHDQCFDIGTTNRKALDRCLGGIDLRVTGLDDPGSEDNGSLMRVVPYSFVQKDRSLLVNFHGCLTHRGPLSQISSWLCHKFLNELLNGKEQHDAINAALKYFDWEVRNYISDVYPRLQDVIGRISKPDFESLPASEISSSDRVVDTLEASIWCLLHSTDYRSAVLNAVNLGEETDTIAALTGGLAGAYYGQHSIPPEWIDALVRRQEVEMMIDGFLEKVNDPTP
ncbi:MAG: ADP-ribosylglycohydrolase family protein [Chitinophagaceae bacterium]|jgi:ADP-ribosyl-[dinitrogen reductase] hydrolase